MEDDIIEMASETRQGSVDGVQVMFRAYIASDKTESLVWRIGDSTGNEALLDKVESSVTLPQGREVIINGTRTHIVGIPRWLTDALMADFDDFDTEGIDPMGNDGTDFTPAGTTALDNDDDEDIKPMFDDIEVDDPSDRS